MIERISLIIRVLGASEPASWLVLCFSTWYSGGRQPSVSLVLVLYITSLWRAVCRLCLVRRLELKFIIGGQHHFACTSIGTVRSVELP